MGNHVGFLCGILALTDVPGILRWDCVATDWFHAPAYPTYLFFNPHPAPKTFQTDVGPKTTDLYDAVSHQFVKRNVSGKVSLTLAPETAAVIVLAPHGGKTSIDQGRMTINGVTIDSRTSDAALQRE